MALTQPDPWDPKDPDEVLDYTLDWASRLGSDTIVTHEWFVVPQGNVAEVAPLVIDSNSVDGSVVKVWLSGGTEGETYLCTSRIVTSNVPARTMDQSIKLKIKSK